MLNPSCDIIALEASGDHYLHDVEQGGTDVDAADKLIALYQPRVDSEIHCGSWLTIDQKRIDAFAEATGDVCGIHTDPQRAAAESPYAPMAHGYLTLSLLPFLTESNAPGSFEANYPGMRLRINYGPTGCAFRRRSGSVRDPQPHDPQGSGAGRRRGPVQLPDQGRNRRERKTGLRRRIPGQGLSVTGKRSILPKPANRNLQKSFSHG